jgi:tripartite-type tricarboxylate transporter receptor subunit TctC
MGEDTKRLDRRGFLKGAVVAGLGVALAGCAPTAATSPTAAPKVADPTKAAAGAAAQPTSAPAVNKINWPEKGKAVTFLVPMSAGSGTDIGARMVATGLERELGIPFQVTNKTGAAGIPSYTELVKAKPDGYTLVCWTFMSGVNAYMDPEYKATYNRKDIQAVAHMLLERNVWIVNGNSKWNTIQELLADAKANPGKIKFGGSGILANPHMTAMMLEKAAGVEFSIVQFPGSGDAMTAMYGGNIDCTVTGGSTVVGPLKAGQVKLLAVTDKVENEYFPGVKTLLSMGYDVVAPNSTGIGAPAGTPKEVVQAISQALKKVYDDPAFSAKLRDMALTKAYMDTDEFNKYIDDIETRMRPFIKEFRGSVNN